MTPKIRCNNNAWSWIDEMLKCENCILRAGCSGVVVGSGELPCDILVIGEAPGREEDRLGIPFRGKSGTLLRNGLMTLFTDYNLFITNCVLCRPPENRDPSPEELDTCWENLIVLLSLAKPRHIITVGRIATDQVGAHVTDKDIKVYSLPHPASVLYGSIPKKAWKHTLGGIACAIRHHDGMSREENGERSA